MSTINKIQISGVTYDIGGSGGGSSNIVEITQSEYDSLDPKDKDTLYVISDAEEVDTSDFATKEELSGKQDKMTKNYLSKVDVGGSSISIETKAFADESVQKTDTVNFKTINGQPIFGMGDIKIEGGGGGDVPTLQEGSNGTEKNYVYSSGKRTYLTPNVLNYFYIDGISNISGGIKFNYNYWGDRNYTTQTISEASQTKQGLMSKDDKIKLDSINTDNLVTKDEFNNTVGNIEELLSKI